MNKNQKGFALVKLIPVILIVIVLAVLGLVVSTFFNEEPIESNTVLGLEKTSGTTYVEGEKLEVFIVGSNYGTLTCSSSNTDYANCYIEASTLVIVPGEKTGTATITVMDITNNVTTQYTVSNKQKTTELSLSNTSSSVYVNGEEIVVSIKGENYGKLSCVSSNSKVATCSISGTKLTIKPGSTAGNATITVTEDKNGVSVEYDIQVSKKTTSTTPVSTTVSLSISKTSGTTYVNGSDLTATISGKNYGKLTCSSSNSKVATCSISGTKLTIKPVAEGTATITVKEGKKSKTVTYKVTVEKQSTLSLSNASALTYVGNELTETISGSNYGTLTCSSSDDSIATCSIVNNTLKVKTNKVGTATITVKESKLGKTVTYNVTVYEKSDIKVSLSLSSTSGVTYTGGQSIDVAISGKNYGQLTCTTTNSKVATCSIKNSILTVNPGSVSGTATITVKEGNKNSYVTYKVTNKKITLSLKSTSGIAYIGGDDLEIAINGTDYGTLSCESADDAIATCAISGTTLIISPNSKVGSAIITVKESIGKLNVEYIVNVNEPLEYECATGVLVEDSEKGGAICVIESDVKDSLVCTEYEEKTTSNFFCNGSYVESVSPDKSVIISCSTNKVSGPIEADGETYNCNEQYFCHILKVEKTCIDGYYEDKYYCPSGWYTYTGTGESLTCYKSATTK